MKLVKTNIVLAVACLTLSACGSDGVWGNARNVLKAQFASGKNDIPHSREEIGNIPYASIAAQLEGTTPALMILGYVDADSLQWIASNKVSISTRDGRIVHTVGFEKDISYVEFVGTDFLGTNPQAINFPISYKIMVDTKSPYPASEVLDCTVENKGEERIEILEISYETYILEEKCESSQGWKVNNLYWSEKETGFVWRSRQGLVNGRYTMEINVLKPFG